jgi:hypothetical protein
MSQRSSDRGRRPGAPRRGGAARAVSTTGGLLAAIARVILLAIMVGALLRAIVVFVDIVVRPSALGSWPHVNAYVAFVLSAACIVLMLALALNSSVLPDRLFRADRLGALFVAVWATGAGAIVVGLVGSYRLGIYVTIEVLPAAMAFALMGLVSPGLYRRPGNASPARSDDASASAAERERARQRRGGRSKR